MKKTFYGVVLFFALTVYSGREAIGYDHNFIIGIGEIGAGTIYSDFNFNLRILDLFIQHEISPFALEIIPVEYNYSNFYDGHILSFLNTKLYFSSLSFGLGHHHSGGRSIYIPIAFIASPFVSVRALNIPNFNSYNYIIDAGFKFAVFVAANNFAYSIINLEIGSKYFKQTKEHTIFISLSSSLIPFTSLR